MFRTTRLYARYVPVAFEGGLRVRGGHVVIGSFGLQRGRALVVAALAVLVRAAGLGAVPRGTPAQAGLADSVRVIVQKARAADPAPELAVRRLGGQVTRALPIVAGFAATVPAAAVDELARLTGVRAVSPDDKLQVQGAATTSTIKSVYPKVVKADAAW